MRGSSHLAAKAGLTVTLSPPLALASFRRSMPSRRRSGPARMSGSAGSATSVGARRAWPERLRRNSFAPGTGLEGLQRVEVGPRFHGREDFLPIGRPGRVSSRLRPGSAGRTPDRDRSGRSGVSAASAAAWPPPRPSRPPARNRRSARSDARACGRNPCPGSRRSRIRPACAGRIPRNRWKAR